MSNLVITISRTYGSGGKSIGRLVAEKMGLEFYDEQLIQRASELSGINEDYFAQADERITIRQQILRFLSPQGGYTSEPKGPESRRYTGQDNLYRIQASVIEQLGRRENCVIIGRAGFYLLRNYVNAVRVHIIAPPDECAAAVARRLSISIQRARQLVLSTNKERADYHKHYTDVNWEDPNCYDLVLNTSRLSHSQCADVICKYAAERMKNQ